MLPFIAFSAVHPRVCGEHRCAVVHPASSSGSSPRMRGTHNTIQCSLLQNRFIPAYAGNTQARCLPELRPPVHPRVCGEHPASNGQCVQFAGSSPRMRGTRNRNHNQTGGRRFIPAYAGNTAIFDRPIQVRSVHPRVCGEHGQGYAHHTPAIGSSPRMRGTRVRSRRPARHQRFIPAYAGNTLSSPAHALSSAVHPRVCGEHIEGRILVGCLEWFIPAYAGNTFIACT